MNDGDWRMFFREARRVLGRGSSLPWDSESWCAWTTFSSLEHWLTYWTSGFPEEHELLDTTTMDGGTWRQAFQYREIAHVVVPATFYWERVVDSQFTCGRKHQDIEALARNLKELGISHRKTDLILEIKLY
ncbi:hypothetical protein [Dokdonella sp.]|uniref:hypothetical protein n=1 Tax=Dokdonella sp. TaxID=2291710 RepID=UPI0037849977